MAKIYSQLERAQLENLTANPTVGVKGRAFFNTIDGVCRYDDGSQILEFGKRIAPINNIANHDAETGTEGWATYADAAGASPVDGTGGAATTAWTRTTSTPLRGLGSFLLTKD